MMALFHRMLRRPGIQLTQHFRIMPEHGVYCVVGDQIITRVRHRSETAEWRAQAALSCDRSSGFPLNAFVQVGVVFAF
jgi:hypothetical protein